MADKDWKKFVQDEFDGQEDIAIKNVSDYSPTFKDAIALGITGPENAWQAVGYEDYTATKPSFGEVAFPQASRELAKDNPNPLMVGLRGAGDLLTLAP